MHFPDGLHKAGAVHGQTRRPGPLVTASREAFRCLDNIEAERIGGMETGLALLFSEFVKGLQIIGVHEPDSAIWQHDLTA